jgi:hypothetical protein
MFYSSKKKRHIVKTLLMVNNQGIIIHKKNHKEGRRHGYDIKRNYPIVPLKEVVNVFDMDILA